MAKWPSREYVRQHVTEDVIRDRIDNLADYNSKEDVANYNGEMSPAVIHAWAELLKAIQDTVYADAQIHSGIIIKRGKSETELRDTALSEIASDMNYNPEKYGIPKDEWE
jgi:precorrin-4 methylase